jgi:hypothetical protein
MSVFLNGLQNFLELINDNWPAIVVCIGLIIAIYKKVKSYLALSEDEKIQEAKAQLDKVVLSLVSKAEVNYQDYASAGQIKRSEVIAEIYKQYPVLSKVVDQEELLDYIDELINEALKTVREIVRKDEEKQDEV